MVSVITLCNGERALLHEACKIVEEQDYDEVEHIIVENCPGIQSPTVALKVINGGSGRRKHLRGADSGIYDALNIGLANATGDFIMVLHCGDKIQKDFISRSLRVARKDVVAIGCVEFVDKHGLIIRKTRSKTPKKIDVLAGYMPGHTGWLVPSGVFDELGVYDEEFRISGDYDMFLRIFFSGKYQFVSSGQIVSMPLDGISTNGLKSYSKSFIEDIRALKAANFGFASVLTAAMKKISKVLLC